MAKKNWHKRSPAAENYLRRENRQLEQSNSRMKALLFMIVVVAASLVVIIWVVPALNAVFQGEEVEPEAPTYDDFSIEYVGILGDKHTSFPIDDSDLDGTLWRVVGGDVDDPYDYQLLKNYTSGLDVDESDFAKKLQAGDALVLIVNGTLPYDDYDDYLDSSYKVARTIYPQQFQLNPTGANHVVLYQKFTDAGVAMLDSETLAVITVATPITIAHNVTFIIGGNASEKDAIYVRQTGLKVKYTVNLLIEFNATVTENDFSIGGMTVTTMNSSALVFEVNDYYSLTSDIKPYYGVWASAVTKFVKFNKVTLRYGSAPL
ncbi:MAG: hypothetical protein Q6373_025525 [Candidatus Sigynarchaeota archaeon]